MAPNLKEKESKYLERARIALTNAENQVEIKNALAEFGVTSQDIAEGNRIHDNTRYVWEMNLKEDAESKVAHNAYITKYFNLHGLFKRHRDFVKEFFHNDPDVLVVLGVKGRFPTAYVDFFNKVEQFYTAIKEDQTLQTKVTRIKITPTVVNECLALHKELLAERSNYDKELGESQDATKSKNAAFAELKVWRDDFDAIAKIALYDKPQLLEALGIFVRS